MSQDSIRNLFEFQRKCKFPEESALTYFPVMYSRDLCLYECRIKKFLDLCKCLPFFYGNRGNDVFQPDLVNQRILRWKLGVLLGGYFGTVYWVLSVISLLSFQYFQVQDQVPIGAYNPKKKYKKLEKVFKKSSQKSFC